MHCGKMRNALGETHIIFSLSQYYVFSLKFQRDQEEYNRLMGKGKRRKQRKRSQTKELTFLEKNKKLIILLSITGVILTSAVVFYLFR